jgi:hypothetical protein
MLFPVCSQEDLQGLSSLDPVLGATPLLQRSFDDLTPCHEYKQRRSPQQKYADEMIQNISPNLEGLDLSGLPSRHSSGKKVMSNE